MNYDAQGFIVQSNGDGGDTAQREGMYAFALALLPPGTASYTSIASKLQPITLGAWVRHPTQYPDPKDFSRDQTTPNIIAMGEYEMYADLKATLKAQIKRFGLFQNGDLPMPETVGHYIRAFNCKWLYPVLLVMDIFMLWSSIEALTNIGKPDQVDQNNCVMTFLQAAEIMPTPFSALSRILYSVCLPTNYGVTQMGETNHVMGALVWYHRAAAGGNPDIAEAYRPLVTKYFGGF